jgi:hypothetical protein
VAEPVTEKPIPTEERMTSPADRILAWVEEQESLSVDRDTDSIIGAIHAQEAVPIFAKIVRELLREVAVEIRGAKTCCAYDHGATVPPSHELLCSSARKEIRLSEALARAVEALPKEWE